MELLPPANILLDFGLIFGLCAAAALLMNVLAARSNREGNGRLPKVDGINRAQRRKERAESRRRGR